MGQRQTLQVDNRSMTCILIFNTYDPFPCKFDSDSDDYYKIKSGKVKKYI